MAETAAAPEAPEAMLASGSHDCHHCDSISSLAQGSILLTEGQHRTLCESCRMPECLRPLDGAWHVDQFDLLVELYHGKTSMLHEAQHRASGHRVAIKQYKKSHLTPLSKFQIEREVRIHIALNHPHIIQLLAAFEDPEHVYLVQEFAPGGDLFEALKHQASMMYGELEAVSRFLQPCLQALAYLHDRGVVHRDLKPENVLLGAGGALKLADFGLAIDTHQERPVTRAGTLDYMAPEVLVCPDKKRPDENKGKASLGYDEQVDAWAAGCLAAELITGAPPFESESRCATYQLIMYREARLPSRISQAARSFITTALAKDPRQRATIYQLLQHEWIKSSLQEYQQSAAAAAAAAALADATKQESACPVLPPSAGVAAAPAPVQHSMVVLQPWSSCSSNGAAQQQPPADMSGDSGSSSSSPVAFTSNQPWYVDNALTAAAVAAAPTATAAIASRIRLPPLVVPSSSSSSNGTGAKQASAVVSAASADAGCGIQATATQTLHAGGSSDAVEAANACKGAELGALESTADAALTAHGLSSVTGAAAGHSAVPEAGSDILLGATACSQSATTAAVASAHSIAGSVLVVTNAPSSAAVVVLGTAAAADEIASLTAAASEPCKVAAEAAAAAAAAAAERAAATKKARLARASSHHGHRLHKIFYPHDKHRRSSFCNAQWDDFIDTSAYSFSTSSAAAAVVADAAAQPGECEVDAVEAASGEDAGAACSAAGGGLLGLVHATSIRSSMAPTGANFSQGQQSLRRRPSATAAALAAADGIGLVSRNPRSFSMSGAGASLAQQAVLAALSDADQQAPAAVLSTAASGSVHLLAATDLEDMIALGPTPSNALSSLGLVLPAADDAAVTGRSCSFSGTCSIIKRLPSATAAAAAACGLQGCGVADECGGEPATGRVLTTLTGSNLDDFIATAAAPGGRVSLLHVSRSSSMAAPAGSGHCSAAMPASPGGATSNAAVAGSSSFSSSLVVTMSSPRSSAVICPPSAPGSGRRNPGSSIISHSAAVPVAAEAAAKPAGLGAKLAARLSCLLPGDGGSGLQHAAASLPADFQREGCSTPSGSKKVVWADEAAGPATGRAGSRPASGCGSASAGCTSGCSAAEGASVPAEHGGDHEQHDRGASQSCSSQPALAPLQPAVKQQAAIPAVGSQFYVPPSGVLSGEALCCPAGVRASKAALAAGVLRHRSASCSPGDLRAAAAGTMGQQHQPQQSSRGSSRPSYVSRRSSSSNGASPVFEAAVPFGLVSAGLLRRGGAASQSMTNLAMAGSGGPMLLQACGSDAEDEIVTRQHARSFSAGTGVLPVLGSRKHGALTPTKVAAGNVLHRSVGA